MLSIKRKNKAPKTRNIIVLKTYQDQDSHYLGKKSRDASHDHNTQNHSHDTQDSDPEEPLTDESSKSMYEPTIIINIRTINSKHVTFNERVITHIVEIEDRKGYWKEDRLRFERRCVAVRDSISFIFDDQHRQKMKIIVNLSNSLRKLYLNISRDQFILDLS